MVFLGSLLVDGLLAGALDALTALGFVVVYKGARLVNFALGEWVMLGALLVAAGVNALQMGLAAALGVACAGMIACGVAFNRLVARHLVPGSLVSPIMATLGAGMLARGVGQAGFADIPRAVTLPLAVDPLVVAGVFVPVDRLVAALVAASCVGGLAAFYRYSRTGVALRAVADDRGAAMASGIDVDRCASITWAIAGVICVLAGTLWTSVTGGGFGMALVGLKVLPIVIVGGLDSVAGAIVGAMLVGVLESLAAGYLDPLLGGGFGAVAPCVVLLAVLFVRPHGLFGQARVERV